MRRVELFLQNQFKRFELIDIWKLVFLMATFLVYAFFKGPLISLTNEVFFDKPFIRSIEWHPFNDYVIILIAILITIQNVLRTEALRLKTVDKLVIIFLIYNFFAEDWVFLQTKISPLFQYVHLVVVYYLVFGAKFFFREFSPQSVESNGYLDLDIPIRNSGEDLLRRKRIASHLYTSICVLRPKKALVLGLSGSWGKGKSSIVNLLREEIEANASIRFIEYNPWMYSDASTLITGFLNLLEGHISGSSGEFHRYKKALLAAEDKIFGTSFSALLTNIDSDFEKTKARVNKLLKRTNRLYVVSIDDLDRLTGEEIVNVFKLVRTIADFTNVVYIVSYDRPYVEGVIKDFVPEKLTGEYLEKMFQVEYSIPEPEPKVIVKTLLDTLELKLGQFFSKELTINKVRQLHILTDLKTLHEKTFLLTIIKTLRDVKRFSNNFLLRYFSIYRDIDFLDFFYLELIRYYSQESYENILSRRNYILKITSAAYTGLTRNENLLKSEEMNNQIFKGQEDIKSIFAELTTPRNNGLYPFLDKLFFDNYFSLDHYSNQISEKELNRILDTTEADDMVKIFSGLIENSAEEDFNYKVSRMGLSLEQIRRICEGCLNTYIQLYRQDQLPDIHRAIPYLVMTCLGAFFKNREKNRIILLRSIYKKSQLTDLGYLSYFLQGFTAFLPEVDSLLKDEKIKLTSFAWIKNSQLLILRSLLKSKRTSIESIINVLIRIQWFIPKEDRGNKALKYYREVWFNPKVSPLLEERLIDIFEWIMLRASLKTQSGEISEGSYSSKFLEIYSKEIFHSKKSLEKFSKYRAEINEFLELIEKAENEGEIGNDLVIFEPKLLKPRSKASVSKPLFNELSTTLKKNYTPQ